MASCHTFHVCMTAIVFFAFITNACAQATARPFLRKINVREVEVDLQTSLSDLLGAGSASATQHLAAIEASVWQTFQALPKNTAGRLAPAAVRYLVHGYFAKEHGWLIKGLEPHGMQSSLSHVHDITILQDKVPLLVERLLEVRQADHGLALSDVVAMVAVLEQLMFDESVTLLEAAYFLNGLSIDQDISEDDLHRVLRSYVVLFDEGSNADLTNVELHQAQLKIRHRELSQFVETILFNYEYQRRDQVNPFRSRRYSFQLAAEIMEVLAHRYGKWQNDECRNMKAHLKELDSDGRGSVPLGLFYAQPKDAVYQFSESTEYLRSIGALEESPSTGNAQVLIANYISGPSNCIATSAYYAVCCISECDSILNELEHQVLAPTASPQKILSIIHSITDTELKNGLPDKLRTIAAHHDGEVPLHGRLFAQWLHFAFPHECPYPSLIESSTALTASRWLDDRGTAVASAQERAQHTGLPLAPESDDFSIDDRWTDTEVLPVQEPSSTPFLTVASIIRGVAMLAAILVALRSAGAALQTAMIAVGGAGKKNDDLSLAFRV